MADLNTYHSAVRVQTRQVFMAIYNHPFLLLKTDEPAPAVAPAAEDDWESSTRITNGIGKTGSFSVLRHNAELYRVYPLKKLPQARGLQQSTPPIGEMDDTVTLKVDELNKETVVISVGRLSSMDVVISDNAVSKHHADFLIHPNGDVQLVDLGSRNGTLVRGRRLAPKTPINVSFGDPIVMGGLALILIGAGALWEIIHAQIDASAPAQTA